VLEIDNRLNSRANYLGERGHDVDEVFAELAAEEAKAEALGLTSTDSENAEAIATNPPQSAERG